MTTTTTTTTTITTNASGASKYWGDERLNDAIYAIYLKKVRYVPPTQFEGLPHYRPIDPDNHHLAEELSTGADHLQWETIRERVIKAGTVEKIIESLIGPDNRIDSRQFNVFFSTYRAFAEPEIVLEKFMLWYDECSITTTNEQQKNSNISSKIKQKQQQQQLNSLINNDNNEKLASKQAIQNTLRSILICWLDTYPEDFYSNSSNTFILLNRLIDFARSRNIYDLKHKARKCREKFKRIVEEGGLQAQIPSISRYCYMPEEFDPNSDYTFAQQRSQLFDISKENCVQIAEQLTFWDAALFRELRPYQCQGAIWGRRHKKNSNDVYSVRATIDQFNAVSQRVMTSVVLPNCKIEFRAKIIEKWIDIARELRALKNFSSLKAVLSSLQSEPVYRLKTTWSAVSKNSIAQFKILAAIFEGNVENGGGVDDKAKNLLDVEGTAKSSPLKRPQLVQNCRRTKSDVNLAESNGTVPFLGTFLTDLTMLDQAYLDFTPEGLVNFEKRRREFEILAKIRLFQSAARAYNLPMDPAFCIWFFYLPNFNENECFTRSLEVEPGPFAGTNNLKVSTPNMKRRALSAQRTDSGKGGRNYTNNSDSSSSLINSKLQSLTKIFTSTLSTTNDNHSSDSISNSIPIYNNNNQQNQTSTQEYLAGGQQSNDSGIHNGTDTDSWLINSSDSTNLKVDNVEGFIIHNNSASTSLSTLTGLNPQQQQQQQLQNVGSSSKISNYSGSEFNPHNYLHNKESSTSSSLFFADFSPIISNNDSINSKKISTPHLAAKFNCNNKKNSNSEMGLKNFNNDDYLFRCSTPISTKHCKNNSLESGAFANCLNNLSINSNIHNDTGITFEASKTNSPKHLREYIQMRKENSQQSSKKSISSSSSRSSYGSTSIDANRTSSPTNSTSLINNTDSLNFHLARVALDDISKWSEDDEVAKIYAAQIEDGKASVCANINYKCIKVENGDRMSTLIERALEKHMIDPEKSANFCLVQLLPDGSEFKLPDNCNPFYAVAPDPTSPMLNFLLKRRLTNDAQFLAPSAKKLNREKRSNLLRWSSGYL